MWCLDGILETGKNKGHRNKLWVSVNKNSLLPVDVQMHSTNVSIQSRAKPVFLSLKFYHKSCLTPRVPSRALSLPPQVMTPPAPPGPLGASSWRTAAKPGFKQTVVTVHVPAAASFGFMFSESNSCFLLILAVKKNLIPNNSALLIWNEFLSKGKVFL